MFRFLRRLFRRKSAWERKSRVHWTWPRKKGLPPPSPHCQRNSTEAVTH